MADRSKGVRITGAKELRREIRRAEGPGLKEALKRAYKESAGVVSTSARREAPVLSGDLRSSIRPLGSQTRAQVAAGRGRSNNYAGVIHYGWPGHNIEAQSFLHEALADEWPEVHETFEKALEKLGKEIST